MAVAAEAPRFRGHVAAPGRAQATLAYGRGLLTIDVVDAAGAHARPATPDEWEQLAAWLTETERLQPLSSGRRLQRWLSGSLVRAVLGMMDTRQSP